MNDSLRPAEGTWSMESIVEVSCLGFVFDPFAQEEIRRIAPPGLKLSFYEGHADIPDKYLEKAQVLIVVAPVTEALLARAPHVRFIQKWGTGYDKIDLDAAARRGIPVAITAGANAGIVAEHAVTLMLAASRHVARADRALRQGNWIPFQLRAVSHSLHGKTVGIIGMGNIGRAVARMLGGFDVEILYNKRGGPLSDGTAEDGRFAGLRELLERSDIVTLHCPGGAANRHMIDAAAIALMKPGAVLINVARGELVDEDALVDALRVGRLSAAGLDVFAKEPLPPDSPLRELDNVVLTPHAAGSVGEEVALVATHALRNVVAFEQGRPLNPSDVIVDPDAEPWRGKRLEIREASPE